jgi:hypothetical protein
MKRAGVGHLYCLALDDNVDPSIPGVAARHQDDVAGAAQIDSFLLGGTSAEVDRSVEPDSNEWCDVWSTVRADCADPEQFSSFEQMVGLLPRSSDRIRGAETLVKLGYGFTHHMLLSGLPVRGTNGHATLDISRLAIVGVRLIRRSRRKKLIART